MKYKFHKIILFGFVLLNLLSVKASDLVMIWVEFNDKENSVYSLNKPHEFLTQRALDRRIRQNIPLDYFDLPVSSSYLNTLSADTAISIYYTSRWFNGALIAITDEESIDRVIQYSFIKSTDRVKPIIKKSKSSQEDENTSTQSYGIDSVLWNSSADINPFATSNPLYWNPNPEYGLAQGQTELVNGQVLHQLGYWGKGKVIAVLDSGFLNVDSLEAFEYLWKNNRILGHKDFVKPGGDVFRTHHHGTHVLSVMGAALYDSFIGAATDAYYWLIRTEDASTEFRIEEYNWLAGAEYADSVGADIINSSLGYSTFDYEPHNYTFSDLNGEIAIVTRAAEKAFSRGILVVNSAGNYGAQSWRYVGTPADGKNVIAVGGTDNNGNRVNFSSVGPTFDRRVKPDVMAQGRAVATVNPSNGISLANGTSFASPLIAGMAACLWQKYPKATNKEIRHAIIHSGNRFLSPDSLYGNGIPDFLKAIEILEHGSQYEPTVLLALNPLQSNSALILMMENHDKISIEFFSSSGQRLWLINDLIVTKGYNEIKPFGNADDLSSGIYFVRMNFSNRTELLKAIKL